MVGLVLLFPFFEILAVKQQADEVLVFVLGNGAVQKGFVT